MDALQLRPAIFLDRDGVLNHQVVRNGMPVSPRRPDEFHLIETAMAAVSLLNAAGFLCIVITNQPDLSRGLLSGEDLEIMHTRLIESAPIEAIYVCGHVGAEGCECRKPKPGMILDAQLKYQIDLRRSWLIGDRWVDVAAANAVGTRAILIEHYHSMKPTSSDHPPDQLVIEARVLDLASAAQLIFASS